MHTHSLWRVHLRLGRVSNLPTVWTNCVAGFVLTGTKPGGVPFVITLLALSSFYTSGMFLNDAFDRDYDRQFRKERPIPSGEISASAVFATGFGFMLLGVALLVGAAMWNAQGRDVEVIIAALLLAGLIVYYDCRHKRDRLSPLIMALCRFMVYVVAAAVAVSALNVRVIGGGAVMVAYLIGLTYVAKQENLRELRRLWPLLFLSVPFLYSVRLLSLWNVGTLAYLLLAGLVIFALSRLLSVQRRDIPKAVVTLIAGISLVDAVLVAGVSNSAEWVWAALAGFVMTLFFQRFVPGT